MKARTLVFVALVALLGAFTRFGTAKPYVRHPVTQEEYAKAIEENDTSLLYIDADEIVKAAPRLVGHEFKTRKEMADWIRSLEVKDCPTNTIIPFSRIFTVPVIRVDFVGWERLAHRDEQCLYEDNRPMASLDCGNFIPRGRELRPAPPKKAALDSAALADRESEEVFEGIALSENFRRLEARLDSMQASAEKFDGFTAYMTEGMVALNAKVDSIAHKPNLPAREDYHHDGGLTTKQWALIGGGAVAVGVVTYLIIDAVNNRAGNEFTYCERGGCTTVVQKSVRPQPLFSILFGR